MRIVGYKGDEKVFEIEPETIKEDGMKLPEKNKRVLAWIFGEVYPFVGYHDGKNWRLEASSLEYTCYLSQAHGKVVAWIDIPESPRCETTTIKLDASEAIASLEKLYDDLLKKTEIKVESRSLLPELERIYDEVIRYMQKRACENGAEFFCCPAEQEKYVIKNVMSGGYVPTIAGASMVNNKHCAKRFSKKDALSYIYDGPERSWCIYTIESVD